MDHPERAALLEMWREQMQVLTLHEQNKRIFQLVCQIKGKPSGSEASPCVGAPRVVQASSGVGLLCKLYPCNVYACGARQGSAGSEGSVASRSRTTWRIFDQEVCLRAWCSLHGLGNSRMNRILQAVAAGRDEPFDDARKMPTLREKVQTDRCAWLG